MQGTISDGTKDYAVETSPDFELPTEVPSNKNIRKVLQESIGEYICGSLHGRIRGIIGSIAIPTSIRRAKRRINDDLRFALYSNASLEYKIPEIVGLTSMVTANAIAYALTIPSILGDLMSTITEDEGLSEMGLGYFASTNLVSLAYEVLRKKPKEEF